MGRLSARHISFRQWRCYETRVVYHTSERIYFTRPTIIYFPIKKNASAGGPRVSRKSFYSLRQFHQSDLAYQRLINCPVNCCGPCATTRVADWAEFCGVKIAIWLIPFRLKGTSFGGSFRVVSGLNEDIKQQKRVRLINKSLSDVCGDFEHRFAGHSRNLIRHLCSV